MSTLKELIENGELQEIEVNLAFDEQKWRRLYGTNEFIKWVTDELVNLKSPLIGQDITPLEQVDAVFRDFIVGKDMQPNKVFKKLRFSPEVYVWEIRTWDIRIFGWFPLKDHFICVYGDRKEDIVTFNKYDRYIAQTKYFREQLMLNEPKFVESKKIKDVLSIAN